MHNICLYIDKKRISPYVMSVYVALKEKGLNFQEKTVDLDQLEQQSMAYRRICPSRKVPCLVMDDFHLFESWAITEYLEDAFPAPDYPALYPRESQSRAKCRAVQALVKTDFMAIRQAMPSDSIFVAPKGLFIASAEVLQFLHLIFLGFLLNNFLLLIFLATNQYLLKDLHDSIHFAKDEFVLKSANPFVIVACAVGLHFEYVFEFVLNQTTRG